MRPWRIFAAILVAASSAGAATFSDDFSTDPLKNGWQVFGNTNLFHWDPTNQNLAVTWDSSQSNSYCYHPLGTIVAVDDEFSLAFDLQLTDAEATGFFQLAVGLFHLADALRPDFSRATGASPNLFEFDYYPDGGFGPSIDATLVDSTVNATNTSDFYFRYDNLPLVAGTRYHILLNHASGEHTVEGTVYSNGAVYASLSQTFAGPITDFRLDTVSVSSYSDAGDTFGDSILAHGTVDNLTATLPPPPIQNLSVLFTNAAWTVQFISRTNWSYTLERSIDLLSWSDASDTTAGVGGTMALPDVETPAPRAFYRVRAARP